MHKRDEVAAPLVWQQRKFPVLGALPLSRRQILGGNSATAERAMHGGSTVGKPPISWMLTFWQVGGKEDPPNVDLGCTRSNGWRNGNEAEGYGTGPAAPLDLIIKSGVGKNFREVGFELYTGGTENIYMHGLRIRAGKEYCWIRI